MAESDFAALSDRLPVKANPSNQNFHQKLITAFAIHHQTTVVSYRPLPRYCRPLYLPEETKTNQGITYAYLPIYNMPFLKQLLVIGHGYRTISRLISSDNKEKPLLIVDSMNTTLRRLAKRIQCRYGIKTIGIVTDNPALLTGVSPTWVRSSLKGMRRFDAFITLTPALNALVNIPKRPSIILPGLVDEFSATGNTPKRPYVFFAGALHERYGVTRLLEAFSKIDQDVDLLIAGHGPDEAVVKASRQDGRIHYLGQRSAREVRELESSAIFNINPRPTDSTLDDYSIPSKFFEYLTSGKLTVSTRHPCLVRLFEHDVLWAGNGSVDALTEAMNGAFKLDEATKIKMALTAKETALTQLGMAAVGEFLVHFTSSLK